MGDVIKPEPPQWEGQEELQAWRKHRERQSHEDIPAAERGKEARRIGIRFTFSPYK